MTSPAATSSPQVGERAPDLRARTQHGETVTLDDLLSGADHARLLLVFYPWAFSGICTGELGALRAGHVELVEAGVRVVAVS